MLKVFSIFDSKAEGWITPFFAVSKGVAIRSIQRAVETEGSDFHRWAADYTLFEIGEWDEREGVWAEHEAKVNMGTALEYSKADKGSEE